MKTKLITITLISLVAVLVLVPLPTLNKTNAQVIAGTLNVSISPDTPDEAIIAVGNAGSSNVPLIVFDLAVGWEAMKITEIEVKIVGTVPASAYRNVKLYDGSTQLGLTIATPGTTFVIPSVNWIVPANSKKALRLTADLAGIGGEVLTGQTAQFTIEGYKIKTIGETTDVKVAATGSAIGNQMILRKSAPVLSTSANSPLPFGPWIAGHNILYQWDIAAIPSYYPEDDIGWKKVAFDISGSITIDGTKYIIGTTGSETILPLTEGVWITNGTIAKLLIPTNSLKIYRAVDMTREVEGDFTVINNPNGSIVTFIASTEEIIAGDETWQYVLKGGLNYATVTGDIILIRIIPKAKNLITSDYTTVASEDASLVWTDISAMNHSTATDDWTNDYKVSGILYDLDNDGVPNIEDPETVVLINKTLEVGEYTFKNLIITNNSVLTLNSDTSLEGFKGVKINAENLTIDSNSSISADKKGYPAGEGPGAGGCQAGGGYGGRGGNAGSNPGGSVYGDLFHPTDLGSGGGSASSIRGGAGGGAIIIDIAGVLTLDGFISANGKNGAPHSPYWPVSGGGSGGSIYITTNNLAGSGLIIADGGESEYGSGGGGRIAIYYDSNDFTGFIRAFGKSGGGAGTVFIKSSAQEYGDIIIDNNNSEGVTELLEDCYTFANLKVLNSVHLYLPESLTAANIEVKNNSVLEIQTTSTFIALEQFEISSSSSLITPAQVFLTIDAPHLAVRQTSRLIGNFNITANDFNLDSTSFISADGKGYSGGEGPGAGGCQAGGGYGGRGGNAGSNPGGSVYGNLSSPIDLGSGGGNADNRAQGGAGGGAIIIDIAGALTIDGVISANGENGVSSRPVSGGGSGGSVYITTNNLAGSGLIIADGGESEYGSGGGGRIAIYYDSNDFTGFIQALGKGNGENGTIIIEEFIPSTLSQLIQQKEINRLSVTVDGQEYYIVTISCYIDPETLKCMPDSGSAKVYVDTEGNPVFDPEISRKIGIIDYVHQLLQKDQFKEDELEKKIKDLKIVHDFILTTDMEDVYVDTIIEIFPTSVNILSELFGITKSEAAKLLLNSMDDLEKDARTDLIIAVSNYEIIKLLVYRNGFEQIITDYDEAYKILDNYLSAQFNEHMARFITDKIYTERYGEEGLDIFINKVAQIVLKTFTTGLSEECLARDVRWKYEIEEEKEIRKIEIQLSETFYEVASYTLKLAQNYSFDFNSTYIDINAESFTWRNLCSPGELRTYDSVGNITGLVNGEIREEIPNSIYDEENKIIIIFEPFDFYYCEVVGTDTGIYKLEIATVENGDTALFTAIDIPTISGQIHRYTIDWDILFQGGKGATFQIDEDGDGIFEQSINSDTTLQPPVASTNGPYEGNEGSPVSFNADNSYDADGEIVLYEWDFNGDGIYDASSTSPIIEHNWGDDYQGEVTLRITDDEGLTDTDITTVNVNDVDPIISNLSMEEPIHPNKEIWAGDGLHFFGSFTDPGWLDTHTAIWDFGDETTLAGLVTEENSPPDATGQVIGSHIYYDKGIYTITLTIEDDDGGMGTDTLTVEVKPIPAVIDCDPDTLNLKSNGKWITYYIELPKGYDVTQIDGSTISLNGIPVYLGKEGWAKGKATESNIMDHDKDGILERMVKFEREKVQKILEPEENAELIINGKVFYHQRLTDFEGRDTIRVINKNNGKIK